MESPRWTVEERPQGAEGVKEAPRPRAAFPEVPKVGLSLIERKMVLTGEHEESEEQGEAGTGQPPG